MEQARFNNIMTKTYKSLCTHVKSNNGQLTRVIKMIVSNASKLSTLSDGCFEALGYTKGIANTINFPAVGYKAFMDDDNITQVEKDDVSIHGTCNIYIGNGKFLLTHPVYVGIKPSNCMVEDDDLLNIINKGVASSTVKDALIFMANVFKFTTVTPASIIRWAKINYKASRVHGTLKMSSAQTNIVPLLTARDMDKIMRNGWWDKCAESLLADVRRTLNIPPQPIMDSELSVPIVAEYPAVHPSAVEALKILSFALPIIPLADKEDNKEANQCVACTNYIACTSIKACGHFTYCAKCALDKRMVLTAGEGRKCPICRAPGLLEIGGVYKTGSK
jgi:hypothetical protein